jgi:hypothetical protein
VNARGPQRLVRADFAERDPAALLALVRRATGVDYRLGRRYPGGAWGAWLVVAPDGSRAVLKCVWDTDWRPRLETAIEVVERLRARGAPIPRFLASGYLDGTGTWYVQDHLDGTPARQLAPTLLAQVLEFIEGMADVAPPDRSWSWSSEVERVLAPGSDQTTILARAGGACAAIADRAIAHLDAARGLRTSDAVHGDLLASQLMVNAEGRLLAVIDWDEAAYGSRAIDLALLFQNVEVQGDRTSIPPDPTVIRRIAECGLEIDGAGFRAAVHYHVVKMLAFVVAYNPAHVVWRLDVAKRVLDNLDTVAGASM